MEHYRSDAIRGLPQTRIGYGGSYFLSFVNVEELDDLDGSTTVTGSQCLGFRVMITRR